MKKILLYIMVLFSFILVGCSTKEDVNKYGLTKEETQMLIHDSSSFMSNLDTFLSYYEAGMDFKEVSEMSEELYKVASDNIYSIDGFDLGFGDPENVRSQEGEELLSNLLSYYAKLDGYVSNIKVRNSEHNNHNIENIMSVGFEMVDIINNLEGEIKEG